ncbi:MAG: hypothetical protein JSV16_00120, partial [Candidatus Hydrogenedentota bacterium]
ASNTKPYSDLLGKISYEALLNDTGAAKVICLGDSNYFYPPDKKVTDFHADLHLPGLIRAAAKRREPQREMIFSEWSYGGANMFDYYCLFHLALRHSPDLIVIPINWRLLAARVKSAHPELSAFVPLQDELPPDYVDPLSLRGISILEQLEYKMYHLYSLYPLGIKNWILENLESFFNRHINIKASSGLAQSDNSTMVRRNGFAVGEEKQHERERRFTVDQQSLEERFQMELTPSNEVFLCFRALTHVASE